MASTRTSFYRYVGQTSPKPLALEVTKAEGIYFFDPNGKKFIDLISGISVSSLGHGNPAIIEAVQKQAAAYMHTMVYGEHIQQIQVDYAKLLCEQLPETLDNLFFTNSGTEATEGAMKLAKKVTGRYEMVACKDAYHGSTHGSQSLMSNEYYTEAYRPFLPGVKFIEFNNIDSLDLITDKTAAVFIEPVQGAPGIRVATKEFIRALRARCTEVGTMLIFDEIQTGFGRTGKLFAFEHYQIVPDVLLMAKAMGGGMPIGGFVTSSKNMKSLSKDPILGYISTFGGHPVCVAAAMASLKLLLHNDLIQGVESKSRLFLGQLRHPQIKEIRYKGLLFAIDLGDAKKAAELSAYLFDKGVLIDCFLYNDKALRIAPPLIISEQEITNVCSILKDGLDQLLV